MDSEKAYFFGDKKTEGSWDIVIANYTQWRGRCKFICWQQHESFWRKKQKGTDKDMNERQVHLASETFRYHLVIIISSKTVFGFLFPWTIFGSLHLTPKLIKLRDLEGQVQKKIYKGLTTLCRLDWRKEQLKRQQKREQEIRASIGNWCIPY